MDPQDCSPLTSRSLGKLLAISLLACAAIAFCVAVYSDVETMRAVPDTVRQSLGGGLSTTSENAHAGTLRRALARPLAVDLLGLAGCLLAIRWLRPRRS